MQATAYVPLLIAMGAAFAVALAGCLRPKWAGAAGVTAAGLALAASVWGWHSGGGQLDLPWAASWNLRLSFGLDGLAALYAILTTGIGAAVALYSIGYMPHHLEGHEGAQRGEVRFHFLLLLFMGAMVGLVMARDLILLFVFWELTTITSYLLIGFDRGNADARFSALMALMVTGVTSILMLVGILLIYSEAGTFDIKLLAERVRPGSGLTTAGLLIAVAAIAKSAQVPLHFWLPRAMVAPTPVSAYLHSAAMVAAGVFLIQRVYPIIRQSQAVLETLLWIGVLSMLSGSVLALTRDKLKEILAYSTIAQYGYVMLMLGIGGSQGAVGATFYVLAHAMVKAALFLVAGAVTYSTGKTQLSEVGGLWRRLPWFAGFSAIAAAGLSGLPLTIGFFKDETFFNAALESHASITALALAGTVFTFVYTWRFWAGIFLGAEKARGSGVPWTLFVPVAALGAVALASGIVVHPFQQLASAAAEVVHAGPVSADLGYHLDTRPTNVLALATFALGGLLLWLRAWWDSLGRVLADAGERFGPDRAYRAGLRWVEWLSTHVHKVELRNLRDRFASIVLPASGLIVCALIVTPAGGEFVMQPVTRADWPLATALLLVACTALAIAPLRDHLGLALATSFVNLVLVAAFTFLGAPDVALVAVTVGFVSTLLFLGIYGIFPPGTLARQVTTGTGRGTLWRNRVVGIVAGAGLFAVAFGILSRSARENLIAREIAGLAGQAHAQNAVTAVLADFRGLDTMGEITVLVIAAIGVLSLIGKERRL